MSIRNSSKLHITILSANGYASKPFLCARFLSAPNLGLLQPFRKRGVMRGQAVCRTSLDKLLVVLCGLASSAAGQGMETQINCKLKPWGHLGCSCPEDRLPWIVPELEEQRLVLTSISKLVF